MAVFTEDGYERASMNKVAARLGGSKATLYGYFSSKEALFAAAMLETVRSEAMTAFAPLIEATTASLDDSLMAFGRAYLAFNLRSDMLELTRLALSEGRGGTLGIRLYEEGVRQGWQLVAEFLQTHATTALSPEDAWKIAMQFKSLLTGDLVEQRLRGVISSVAPEQIRATSEEAMRLIRSGWPEVFSAVAAPAL